MLGARAWNLLGHPEDVAFARDPVIVNLAQVTVGLDQRRLDLGQRLVRQVRHAACHRRVLPQPAVIDAHRAGHRLHQVAVLGPEGPVGTGREPLDHGPDRGPVHQARGGIPDVLDIPDVDRHRRLGDHEHRPIGDRDRGSAGDPVTQTGRRAHECATRGHRVQMRPGIAGVLDVPLVDQHRLHGRERRGVLHVHRRPTDDLPGGAVLRAQEGSVDRHRVELIELLLGDHGVRLHAAHVAPVVHQQRRTAGDLVELRLAAHLHVRAVREQGAAGRGAGVDVVTVDVDRHTAVGGVVSALVLVQALVVDPLRARDVIAVGVLLAVPLGVPDLVGLDVTGAATGSTRSVTPELALL